METEDNITNVFKTLYKVDVGNHLEKKGNFDYLKWAVAVRVLLEHYPLSSWRVLDKSEISMGVEEADIGGFVVGTEVTVRAGGDEIKRREFLPIINYSNKIIQNPDFMAVNTAIKRCLVKNIAMFGLGLKVFEGEPMGEDCTDDKKVDKKPAKKEKVKTVGELDGKMIHGLFVEAGYSEEQITEKLKELYGIGSCSEIEAENVAKIVSSLKNKIEYLKGEK